MASEDKLYCPDCKSPMQFDEEDFRTAPSGTAPTVTVGKPGRCTNPKCGKYFPKHECMTKNED